MQADNIAKNGSFTKIKLSSTVLLTVKELLEDGRFEDGNFCQSLTIFKIFANTSELQYRMYRVKLL